MENLNAMLAKKFRALGDENRLVVLSLLVDGEKCACQLQDRLNISQSTLSHHMKILCDCGIVNYRKEGKWMHYSICQEQMKEVIGYLKQYSFVC